MAYFFSGQSHTFNEYLLVPGYSSSECIPDNVSLRTPLTRFRAGEEPALSLNVPMVSAVMQSVSGDRLAVALAQEGGVSFLYGSQSIEDEAAMVARVKSYKAGFVRSDSNISPDATLADILALREQTGHSTVAVTEDGTADGRLVGIVTSRDYRVSRMDPQTKVREFMTPREKMITAPDGTTLKEANNIIWEHKLNSLPIVNDNVALLGTPDDRAAILAVSETFARVSQSVSPLLFSFASMAWSWGGTYAVGVSVGALIFGLAIGVFRPRPTVPAAG